MCVHTHARRVHINLQILIKTHYISEQMKVVLYAPNHTHYAPGLQIIICSLFWDQNKPTQIAHSTTMNYVCFHAPTLAEVSQQEKKKNLFSE